jgi:alkanesulfonate monooxygenase SsuD/methylene tetrahydromethanopterin reductase-like flavin-dependent oxidoreductase (luciferase family)
VRVVTVPALLRGREKSGRTLEGFIVLGSPFVVTGRTEEEMAAAADGVRGQIAFYGSTPAYRGVLEQYGWGELGDELNSLSRQGRWAEMGPLVDDDVLAAFAVVGNPSEAGSEIVRRYGDVFDRITLYMPYQATPEVTAEITEAIRGA